MYPTCNKEPSLNLKVHLEGSWMPGSTWTLGPAHSLYQMTTGLLQKKSKITDRATVQSSVIHVNTSGRGLGVPIFIFFKKLYFCTGKNYSGVSNSFFRQKLSFGCGRSTMYFPLKFITCLTNAYM
jgi:hypothetical protein